MMHTPPLPAGRLLLDRTLSIPDAISVVTGKTTLELTAQALARCDAAHTRLQQIIAEERHVYGLTTGFGPLANRLVDSAAGAELQQNLIHHLASGVGPVFTWQQGRAIVLARLMSIVQGASGASAAAISALVKLLNSRLAPAIPCRGTVGASGDLTPLAHMVLCLQARADFLREDGRRISGKDGLDEIGIPPIDLSHRDGLALVNGTSAMTGLGVLNAHAVARRIGWAVALTGGMAETQAARIEAWDDVFSKLRPHPGQVMASGALRSWIRSSGRVVRDILSDRKLAGTGFVTEKIGGQDAYSLRCAPQVIGAVWDTALWHDSIVETELNSATDNPLFPEVDGDLRALHGGNFMGQHVGLASDALATAVVVLGGLAERQIARLTDETLNRGLPPFLHRGTAGLNSGLMGAQVTATALLAEMRSIGPASIHSISTNGANQDVVSMGTIAARHLAEKLGLLAHIQAVLAVAVAQAMDILESMDKGSAFSSNAHALREFVRFFSPPILSDRPLGQEIETLAEAMSQSDAPGFPVPA